MPPVSTLLIAHICMMIINKDKSTVINNKVIKKAKRVALTRYHPDKHNTLIESDSKIYNAICELSKVIIN